MEQMRTRHRNEARPLASGLLAMALVFGNIAITQAATPYQGEGHVMIEPSELDWKPVASMTEGAEIAVLEGDLSSEQAFTIRLRLPADYKVAPHTHPAYERVTVLTGTFHFAHGSEFDPEQTQALGVGSLAIMAPGEPMYAYTEEETIIQLHGTGPWGVEYVNPEDDPRN